MICEFLKQDGKQCQATAMKSSTMCFVHNPDTKDQHQAAVVKVAKQVL